jgi:hypothetical protein
VARGCIVPSGSSGSMHKSGVASMKGFSQKTLVSLVTRRIWHVLDAALLKDGVGSSVATINYLRCYRGGLTVASPQFVWESWMGTALQAIAKMRVGGFATLSRMKVMFPGTITGVCIFCNCVLDPGISETAGHLLIECPAWANLRVKWLKTHIEECVRLLQSFPIHHSMSADNVAILLLGGSISGASLPGSSLSWIWHGFNFVVDPEPHLGPAANALGGISPDNRPVACNVASFLRVVLPLRQRQLKAVIVG